MSNYIALKHDPCPYCGMEVTRFSVTQEDDFAFGSTQRVAPSKEIVLWPCGHDVNSYTIDTNLGTVAWNTLSP